MLVIAALPSWAQNAGSGSGVSDIDELNAGQAPNPSFDRTSTVTSSDSVFDLGVIVRQGLQYALARGVLLSAVPAQGILLLADLLVHGQQPLVEILRSRGWIYIVLGGLAATAYAKD